jgi:hypothetical protein
MYNSYAQGFVQEFSQTACKVLDALDIVEKDKDLTASVNLARDCIDDKRVAVFGYIGYNRAPVDWWGVDGADVTHADQRHVKCARRRRRHHEGMRRDFILAFFRFPLD